MKSKLEQIYDSVSLELSLEPERVKSVYRLYWKAIREMMADLPLKENLTEEEFSKLKTSFNIPHLGKFYCLYRNYKKIKQDYAENKETKTHV